MAILVAPQAGPVLDMHRIQLSEQSLGQENQDAVDEGVGHSASSTTKSLGNRVQYRLLIAQET